jgi:class 3 adenylate cyclase
MFTDIVDSTEHLVRLGDHAWKELLDQHDAITRRQIERFRGRAIKQTGDGALATFDGPARAVECARAIQASNQAIGLQVRVGLHVGECELRGDDIGGMAVHTASRVADAAGPGEILVSSTLKDLVAGSGLEFTERGRYQLRGVPGEWTLFAVDSP